MTINNISKILESEKEEYINNKVIEYMEKGYNKEKAINKANQSWRAYIGNALQNKIYNILKENLQNKKIKVISDKNLIKNNLDEELDLVKRLIAINYGKYFFIPDGDIILYTIPNNNLKELTILAIISIKNSFRERGFETTYWKLKLKESHITSGIKVFLITPDKDNEISYKCPNNKPKKMRIILEYELDGIYFLKEDFEKCKKVKHFEDIFNDILKLIKNNK